MAAENLTRRCCDCHTDLPTTSFYIHLRKPRGVTSRARWYFSSRCKGCSKLASRNWVQLHQSKAQEYSYQYRLTHKAEKRQQDKLYREHNRDGLLKKKSDYAKRPDVRARIREKARSATGLVRQKMNEHSRNARLRNPERRRAISKNNKIKRRQSAGTCTPAQWLAKCGFWGWRCYLCGQSITSTTLHMEHRTPLSRGGSHWPANLAPACEKCNLSKNNKTEAEYRAIMKSRPLADATCDQRDLPPRG